MRRVVTGHKNSKSVILEDQEIKGYERFGYEMINCWKTESIPTIPVEENALKKQLSFMFPKSGETSIGIWTCPPDKDYFAEAKANNVDLIAEWREQFHDDLGMHTSDTIDYNVILSGQIWMEVDNGVEVQLNAGDLVVQNGTRHAWRNKGTENCVIASVLIGAERLNTTKKL